jgi:transposase
MANAIGRPTVPLVLSSDERDYLERQVRRHRVARSMSERCRIILRCGDGLPSKVVAAELGVHEHTVGKWRRRFLKDRIEGLLDEARTGRPRTIDDDQIAAVIERTLRSTPTDATHWSIRSMAGATGFSHTTIRRIWTAFGLQPHRSETFKLSSDPLFVDKVRDIVGLYLSPPNRALVLSVDEKSQIQALDREQPVLPMMPGVPERRTHSYVRSWHDFIVCRARHRVRLCHRQMLQAASRHRVSGLHQTDRCSGSQGARRSHHHGQLCHPQNGGDQDMAGTPAALSCAFHSNLSLLDQSGRTLVCRTHPQEAAARGPYRQLEADIRSFIEHHNENPRPYKWIKSADEILSSVKRFCQKAEQTLCGEL